MKKMLPFILFIFITQVATLQAQNQGATPCNFCSQYLYWTGEVDNDFFNEDNWRIAVQKPSAPNVPNSPQTTPGQVPSAKPYCLPGANKLNYQICLNTPDLDKDKHPKTGTLEPGQAIQYNLYASTATIVANGVITFDAADKGFTMNHVDMEVNSPVAQGILSIDGGSTVRLTSANALGANAAINLLDAASWVYFLQDNPEELLGTPASLRVDDATGMVDQNLRINQYYQQGALVRKRDLTYTPLTIYSGASGSGSSAALVESTIYAGGGIPGGMNNQVSSFVLKRGYMVTLAIQDNGTGKSKVYIASEADLTVDVLPAALQGNVSFIRVLPWNWVTKKGTGGLINGLDAGWFYNWGNGATAQPNQDYVPMAWGAGAASPASLNQVIQKEKATHLLGFNESDNCNDQSGQFNNLCEPEVAVAYYENLMRTGLRLGTPAPRENGPTTWLKEFARLAKERDVRFDFVAVHWYDWGSNPANSPNADPVQVFNRFKAYLANVHAIYGLPIWITEFNANPNRENSVHAAFLELALPYLEQLDYVERYAFFQPNPQYASNVVSPSNYYDTNGAITNIGIIYRDQTSTPSIPEASMAAPNNLEGMDLPYVEVPADIMAFEAECGLYKGNQWEIKEDLLASNERYIQANTSAVGATGLAQQTHFEFESEQNETLRLWVRLRTVSGANGSLKISMDGGASATIGGMNAGDFTWFRIPRYYTVGTGKHRLTITYANGGTQLDKLALVNSSAAIELAPDAGNTACILPDGGWGIVDNPTIYWLEGETPAQAGAEWEIGTSSSAIGGQFIQPIAGVSAISTPPGAAGIATYTVEVANDDEFNIWGKVQALSPDAGAFWFSVDGEPFRKWDGLENIAYEWKWTKFHFSEGSVNRPFTYFLSAGSHTIELAYSEAGAKLDRLAVASTSLNPASVDPDVLLPNPVLDFEAENAVILGTATIVNCGSSSNGKQVNMGTATSNGVRFANVAVPIGGAYRLTISYMSAVPRNVRLRVNDVDMGIIAVTSSGAWCFAGGVPADFLRSVDLNAGTNTIEFRPVGTESPFMDKISLVREASSFEAELAEINGAASVVTCAKSSNGAAVNMFNVGSNSVRFANVEVSATGTYMLDISYLSKVARQARIFVNDNLFQVATFDISGSWCFEGGTPRVKSFEIPLTVGMNSIEIKPVGGADAPFIDKIAIVNMPEEASMTAVQETGLTGALGVTAQEEPVSLLVYPNPATANGEFFIRVNAKHYTPFDLHILDVYGRTLLGNMSGVANQPVRFGQGLAPGVYFVVVNMEATRYMQKLIIR
ncbi:MAG: T9SS type A sorting domain-containing protein [Lewinellaceae bacterium]|nr:T9SS type A sorting domain-containing protein [Lewinellaceae bacterium]